MIRPVTYLLPLAVSACAPAPVSVERAMTECRRETPRPGGVSGQMRVGVGSDGLRSGLSLVITGDALRSRSAEETYARCVKRKSGQWPADHLAVQ